MGRASPALRPATRPPTGEPLSDPHEPAGADLDESLRFYGLRRAADGSHTWIRRQAPRPESAIPARTLENLAACAALGLAYWSEAPGANRLWGLDWRTDWPAAYANWADAPTGGVPLNYDDPAQALTQAAPTVRMPTAPTIRVSPTPTRIPYSPRRRSVAGWLSILGGITFMPWLGRAYAGYGARATTIAMLWLLGVFTVFGFIGSPILLGLHVYAIVDGLIWLSGADSPKYTLDGRGRPMR